MSSAGMYAYMGDTCSMMNLHEVFRKCPKRLASRHAPEKSEPTNDTKPTRATPISEWSQRCRHYASSASRYQSAFSDCRVRRGRRKGYRLRSLKWALESSAFVTSMEFLMATSVRLADS